MIVNMPIAAEWRFGVAEPALVADGREAGGEGFRGGQRGQWPSTLGVAW